MKEKDYTQVYNTAKAIIAQQDYYIKNYFSVDNLALWFLVNYSIFDIDAVCTTRLVGTMDVSIILSHNRLSLIINDNGQATWTPEKDAIKYEDLELDIQNMMNTLNWCFAKIEF